MRQDEILEAVEETAEEEGFAITDDSTAEWALKKILAARREKERLTALVKAEKEELDRQQEQIDKRYEQETAYLLVKLGEYFDTVEHKKTKTQETYQLLSGKLILKKPKQVLSPDNEALLKWCKENAPDFVKVTESVAWGELKKRVMISGDSAFYAGTGEAIDCISITEEAGTFDVKGG